MIKTLETKSTRCPKCAYDLERNEILLWFPGEKVYAYPSDLHTYGAFLAAPRSGVFFQEVIRLIPGYYVVPSTDPRIRDDEPATDATTTEVEPSNV